MTWCNAPVVKKGRSLGGLSWMEASLGPWAWPEHSQGRPSCVDMSDIRFQEQQYGRSRIFPCFCQLLVTLGVPLLLTAFPQAPPPSQDLPVSRLVSDLLSYKDTGHWISAPP